MTIYLEDIFRRVIRQSSLDANKGANLVMEAGDAPLFVTYVDMVVMDIVPKLAGYLEENTEVTSESITIDVTDISSEGEMVLKEAVSLALVSGVLYYFQRGGGEQTEHNNKASYDRAIKMVATAVDYRRQNNIQVIKREL